jgi:L-serine dehydratase
MLSTTSPTSYPEFYNDVFGPIMQPGSSSHTAAPCRLGYLANSLLGEPLREAHILLDRASSFSGTFGLMAEDSAMLAGALGFLPDDARLFQAKALAAQAGIAYAFEFGEMKESLHPNAVKFILTGQSGRVVSLVGDSTGGGMIETRVIDGYPFQCKGDVYALLFFDPQDALQEPQLAEIAARLPALVGRGRSGVPGKGSLVYFLTSDPPDLAWARSAYAPFQPALLKPILPVLTRPDRQPQLFATMTRWREIALERDIPFWEVAVQYEMDASGWTRAAVLDYMRMLERKMYRQTHAPYEETLRAPASPFKPDMAAEWAAYQASSRRLSGDMMADTIKWAYGAGAGIPGVEVVAGPMGSGGGYVHAALWAVKQANGFSDEDLLRGLFIAAGIGAIAFSRTEPTGEVTGCTGETGICGAMAAAAIAEMAGASPQQVEDAASMLLQAVTGVPCDPIPGGFGQPCRSRILTTTCMASVFADLALAGRSGVLPLHEAIDVADAVGRRLPTELLCTSLGGCAAAPTALRRAVEYRAWQEQTEKDHIQRPPGNLI